METHNDISDKVHRIPCNQCDEIIIISDEELITKGSIKCEKFGHEQLITTSKINKSILRDSAIGFTKD